MQPNERRDMKYIIAIAIAAVVVTLIYIGVTAQ
jgi:hypothetical protein